MIDLPSLARRQRLPIDERGQAIPAGNGRIVAFGPSELAYTTSVVDDWAVALLQSRIGRVVYRTANGLTVSFPPARLDRVLGFVGRSKAAA